MNDLGEACHERLVAYLKGEDMAENPISCGISDRGQPAIAAALKPAPPVGVDATAW